MGSCKQCNLKRIKALYEERKAAREKAEYIALSKGQDEKQEPKHEFVVEEFPKKAGRRKKKDVLVEVESPLVEKPQERESLSGEIGESTVEFEAIQEVVPEEVFEIPEVAVEQVE